jgi:serine protease
VAPGGDTSVDQNGDGYGDGVLQQTFATNQPTNFGFWFFQGTSMASPHVAGVAALVWAAHPEYSASDVRNTLEKTAKDLGAPGWDQYYGNGLVNAAAAVAYSPGDTQPPVVTISNPANGSTVSGTITVGANATDNVGGTSVGYRIDGGATVPMSNTGGNTYEAAWNTTTASNGSHTVTVQASDAAGNMGSSQVGVTVSNVAPPNTSHVAAIVMALQKTGSSTAASATVTIVDNNGSPVRSATVSGSWSGLTSGSSSGTTGKTGTVKLTSKSVRNAHGTFTFTVTSVSRSGYTYDSAANVETSDSITVP